MADPVGNNGAMDRPPPRDDDLRVNSGLVIPATELTWRFSTSGGPGGQHANTSNTRAEVVFEIEASAVLGARDRARLTERFGSQVSAAADDTRSQLRNRQLALERLTDKVQATLQTKKSRRATKPGRGAKERRLRSKKQRSQLKQGRRKSYDND